MAKFAGEEALVVGGLLGDFVKGPLVGALPAPVELGVRLHRAIDAETARDVDMRQSVLRFDAKLRRVAPILLDIAADHLLAQRFADHELGALAVFSQRVYTALSAHANALPNQAREFAERLQRFDALTAYQHTDIVERGFERVLLRLRKAELIPLACAELHRLRAPLALDFERYYPRLESFAARWLSAVPGSS